MNFRSMTVAAALAVSVFLATPVMANGLGQDAPWGFATPSDTAAKTGVLTLMQLKDGGAFGPATSTYIGTQVTGPINCPAGTLVCSGTGGFSGLNQAIGTNVTNTNSGNGTLTNTSSQSSTGSQSATTQVGDSLTSHTKTGN